MPAQVWLLSVESEGTRKTIARCNCNMNFVETLRTVKKTWDEVYVEVRRDGVTADEFLA